MEKYRTYWSDQIEKLTVLKETDKTIWFVRSDGRNDSERIKSDHHSWHDTFDEAVEHLVNKQLSKIKIYEANIEFCRRTIEKIKQIKPD